MEIYYLAVNKLSTINLNASLVDNIMIYDEPVIKEYFKKTIQSIMQLSFFQCFIVYVKNRTKIINNSVRFRSIGRSIGKVVTTHSSPVTLSVPSTLYEQQENQYIIKVRQ